MKTPRLLTLAVLALPAAAAVSAVGVLVEPGMVKYGGTPSVPPERVVALLRKYGLDAQALSVDQMAKDGALNTAAFPVLVLPYGNAFPLSVFPQLRAYHRSGGCLVMNGVPFCHPCEKQDGKWRDLGHVNYFQHDGRGIGTGGFRGPAEGVLRIEHYGFQPNPLGLSDGLALPDAKTRRQWLDTSSLSAEDEVIPLVGLIPEGSKDSHPVSAIIRHNCDEFRGAIDVWVGQVAPTLKDRDAYFAQQMLVRSVAWCLRQKGQLAQSAMAALFSRMDAAGRPEPLPAGLDFMDQPRPWGDTFLPKSKPPARRLFMVDTTKCRPDERIALACLQGLTSREQPRIWLHFPWRDRFWLDWHRTKGYIDGYDAVEDWRTLFRRFAGAYRGAILPDEKLYRGALLAANVAACEDLIVATPRLAKELGLSVKVDLRGRFETYADGMAWVWDTYKRRLSHHLCDFMHPQRLGNGAFAYDLQWRAAMFWIAGPVDASEPGADLLREKQLIAKMLAEMAPNAVVLGFPFAGKGIGLGEVDGVALASRYAKPLVCTDSLSNTCVMSGVALPDLEQHRPAPPKLDRGKIYIALNVSDGDNQNVWIKYHKRYFVHDRFGEVSVAFGMGPPIMDLMPAVAQWYYERGGPSTEFFADVSGVGYVQPQSYGTAYRDRDAVFAGFLGWTREYLAKMDMKTVRPVRGEDDLLVRYSQKLPSLHSVFADMGCYSGRKGIQNLTYALPTGLPVFRSATTWRHGKDGFLREIREHVGATRPAFVNGFVHCWTFRDMADIARIYDERDGDMVFVTPSQLADLYVSAADKGPK